MADAARKRPSNGEGQGTGRGLGTEGGLSARTAEFVHRGSDGMCNKTLLALQITYRSKVPKAPKGSAAMEKDAEASQFPEMKDFLSSDLVNAARGTLDPVNSAGEVPNFKLAHSYTMQVFPEGICGLMQHGGAPCVHEVEDNQLCQACTRAMEELSETKEGEAEEEAKEEAGEQILPDGCERLAGLCTVTHPNGDISIVGPAEVLFMVKVLKFAREDQGMRPAAEQKRLEDNWVKALCAKAGPVVKQKDAASESEPARASVAELDSTVGESKDEERRQLLARERVRQHTADRTQTSGNAPTPMHSWVNSFWLDVFLSIPRQ
jgi:hypothetical protein